MLPEDYKIRCDKHNFKPYEYCEMCWMRNYVQEEVEKVRKDSMTTLGETHLAISVLNDCFSKIAKEIIELKEHKQRQIDENRKISRKVDKLEMI